MARLLAVVFFALVGTQSASAIMPTRKDMKDMAVNYWVRQVGPSDDISNVLAVKPTNISKITKEDMKDMAVNYWVRQVGPSDDITKASKTVEEAAKPGKEDMKDMAVNYWVRQVGPSDDITNASKTVEEAAKPGKEDMKDMAVNYWVRQVGPSDDLESGRNSSSRDVRRNFTMSFAGTPLGMLTPEQYLEGGKQMAKFGFAQTFGNDTNSALTFVNRLSGWTFKTWQDVEKCGLNPECHSAWQSDPGLIGHNATLVSVQAIINGVDTVRCHNHFGGIWCHENVETFNEGKFYIVEVAANDDPTLVRTGLVMCHEWPEEYASLFEKRDGTKCHTMPVGLVLPKKTIWCAQHDCRQEWTV